MPPPGDWRDAVVRAGDRYAFAPPDDLSRAERAVLVSLNVSGGVLRPQRPWLSLLALDAATAALYTQIDRAPGRAARQGSAARQAVIERLIHDGVLELQAGKTFLTGAAAYGWMAPEPAAIGVGRVARLSRDAVAYGQTVSAGERAALSRRLYQYGRLPLSAAWRRRLPSSTAVAQLLGVTRGGRNRTLLDAAGHCSTDVWWLRWRARRDRPDAVHRHKLYMSPAPAHLPEAFSRTVRVLVASGTPRFKVVRTTEGVLRPDKLVAYFADPEHAAAVAARLGHELAGIPAHGVPFTSPIDSDGLLSLGLEPPMTEALPDGQATSWRRWVTDRLASALIVARHTPGSSREPWQFALHRLTLAGVDVTTWWPSGAGWAAPGLQ